MHYPFRYQDMQLGSPVISGVAIFLAQSSPEFFLMCLLEEGVTWGKNFSQTLDFEVSLQQFCNFSKKIINNHPFGFIIKVSYRAVPHEIQIYLWRIPSLGVTKTERKAHFLCISTNGEKFEAHRFGNLYHKIIHIHK